MAADKKVNWPKVKVPQQFLCLSCGQAQIADQDLDQDVTRLRQIVLTDPLLDQASVFSGSN